MKEEIIQQKNTTTRKFHVYIIESPSAPDLYLKRFEGESLNKTLQLSGISSSHYIVVNSEAFHASFYSGLVQYFQRGETMLSPIIHISAHGFDQGIQLTSGEVISWEQLKILLIPANRALNGGLLVSLSSCESFNGCIMAMDEGELPFCAIIANQGKPTWGETNIAFSTFYHLFSTGRDIKEAVKAMKISSGNNEFIYIAGQEAQSIYLRKLHSKQAISTISSVGDGTSGILSETKD